MPTMSSTLGIHRGLLLLVVISVILVAFVSASPSPQALSAAPHQNRREKPKDVRIPCNFNGYNGFFVKRWQCDDRAREGTCFCAAVAVTDPLHNPFLASGQISPDLSSTNRQDYEECCMQIQCIEDAVYNAAGQYSCMDTTSIISPSLCYSGKGIFVPNLCPNLPETIQCCTAPPPRRDPFQPLTYNIDSGANDYTDFNSLPIDYYEEASWQ